MVPVLPEDSSSRSTERRTIPRWSRTEPVSVQLRELAEDGSSDYRILDTRTIEVSEQGLRLWMDQKIEKGRLFDICVELRHHPQRFLLVGEARWCRWDPNSRGYEVGVAIQDSEETDYQVWAEMVQHLQDDRRE